MLRQLSAADYGILATVFAITAFPALAVTAIGPMVVRFAGEYFALGKLEKVRGLYLRVTKAFYLIALVIFFLFLLLTPQMMEFFHLKDAYLFFITNIIIFFGFVGIINIQFIQAKLAFLFQVSLNFIGAIVKLIFGVILVFLGYSYMGAIYAVLASSLAVYIISFIPLRFVFNKKLIPSSTKAMDLISYGLPSTLALLGLTSFISADIILVKHFFSPTLAGIYAGVALIGKIIFYLSAPIGTVMFPLVVQKHAKNENYTNTFILSMMLVFVPSLLLSVFYSLFPNFTILLLTYGKKEYLLLSPLLGYLGMYFAVYCLLTIVTNFYLSINKTKVYIPILIGAVLQILLILLYHNTFFQIVIISLVITFVLLIGLLLYYPYATKK